MRWNPSGRIEPTGLTRWPKVFREDVLGPFTLGGTAQVPAGSYDVVKTEM